MGRSPCCDKVGLKKGPWTPEEDQKLLAYIEEHGHGNWRALPSKAGLQRCGKSCRLRWTNYLRPDIKRGKFSLQEEQTIIQLHALLGNRWSAIATHLPKRTDNEIKNYWNTHLKKRLAKMGIDPITHKPKNDALLSSGGSSSGGGGSDINGTQSKTAANLSHMAQWESARLEAEARLARQSKSQVRGSNSSSSSSSNSVFQSQFQHHFGGVPPACTGMVMDFPHYPTSNSSSSSLNHNVITGQSTPSVSPPPPAALTTIRASSCLDVIRGSSNWPKSSSTGSGRSNADVGSSSGAAGVAAVHHSPTSTLSFSENGTVIGVQGGESSTAAVIEFMGNNNKSNEEGSTEEEWKLTDGFGKNNSNDDDDDDHNEYNNDGMENSMSFTSGFHHHHHHPHDMGLSIDKNHRDETEDENHNITTVGNFIDGFTELLLSNFPERNIPLVDESENRDETDNASGGDGEGVRSGEVDQLYEDNKSYWNSILNLVNSSPSSSSPLF